MPSVSRPPGTSRASKTTTSCPSRRSSCAQESPPGPSRSRPRVCRWQALARKPMHARSDAASQANRWSRPICTGAFISARSTHAPSQRTSVGQARAQLPPKMLASRIVRAAADFIVVEDLANESRDVDMRWAGPGARGVETKQAARRLDARLVDPQGRRYVGEPRFQRVER